jgi:peptidyl-prolyl cis-trans isomerase C
MPKRRPNFFKVLAGLLLSALIASCGTSDQTPSVAPQPSQTPQPLPTHTLTPTPFPPSPTPIPLAAMVNGEGISLSEYQSEQSRYRAAQQNSEGVSEQESQQRVLDDLVNQVLLAQGAQENGFSLTEEELDARLTQLIEQAGGEGMFNQWLSNQGYSREAFKTALARNVAAAWMRDRILSKVPDTAEQVRAQQILLYNSDQAEEVLSQLESGQDFDTLADTYNLATLGDLGWFPRGYLTVPEVEEAAFSLQPGETSGIIESQLGYHIIQVLERDPNRPLDPDARRVLKEKALQEWLETSRNQGDLQIYLKEGTTP